MRGVTVQLEASVGIALCPDHGLDVTTLVQRADVAMYEAKREEGHVRVYDAARDPNSPARLQRAGELRAALAAGELVLHYQPKVAVDDGEVTGVEALVRWEHPRHGLLAPAEFLPLAERAGMMGDLTRWVIDAALQQARAWQDEGIEVRIAVNLAAANILDAGLPDAVAERLAKWGVPGERLTCELSEHTVMGDPRRAQDVLDRLRALGVRLSLDDYGTGHSSLSYLKRLPLDEVKIDRAFVAGIVGDTNDALIVRSTIDLARNLGLEVVAEGVEGAGRARPAPRAALPRGAGLPPVAPAAARGAGRLAAEPSPDSAGLKQRLEQPAHARERALLQAAGDIRGGVAERVVRDAELAGDEAGEAELAVVRVAGPLVGDPADADAAAGGRRAHAALEAAQARRAQPQLPPTPDLVERERPAQVARAAAPLHAADQRARAEVVGLSRVDPLLGAGRDEPDVAARGERGDAGRERDQRPDAGRVVLGAGRRRHRVGVRHQDPEAVAGPLDDADHVARAPLAGDREAVVGDGEAGRRERLRNAAVGASLRRSGRGPRARRARGCARTRSRGRRLRPSARASRRRRRASGGKASARG